MKTLYALVLVLLVGCSTPSKRSFEQVARHEREMEILYQQILVTPPKLALRKSLKPLPAPVKTVTYEWKDCSPQPMGVTYRIYETVDFKTWTLRMTTTNHYVVNGQRCANEVLFGVSSVERE